MRSLLAAALGASLVFATGPAGVAATLAGSKFPLLDGKVTRLDADNVLVYRSGPDGFGLLYGKTDPARTSAKIYLQLFDLNGAAAGERTLVLKETRKASDTAFDMTPAGGALLADGRSVVAANLTNGSKPQFQKFFGQMLADNAPVGERFSVERRTANFAKGHLIQMTGTRGLVYWQEQDAATGAYATRARYILPTGEQSKTIEVHDRPYTSIANRYLDGFVLTTFGPNPPVRDGRSFSQRYDSDGGLIDFQTTPTWSGPKTAKPPFAVALHDGYICVIKPQPRDEDTLCDLREVGPGSYWHPVSSRPSLTGAQLGVSKISYHHAVVAFPPDRFTSAWANIYMNSMDIHVRVYTRRGVNVPGPRQIGPNAVIKMPLGSTLHQILPLPSGDLLAVLLDGKNNMLKGQLIRP